MGLSSMKPHPAFAALLLAISLVWVFSATLSYSHAAQDETLPDVGVDEKLGVRIPLDLNFTDQDGKAVRLGDYFTGGPVILTLNYYACPTLCPLVFRNLSNTISGIKGLSVAKDYSLVTVSIDPEETLTRARAKAEETWLMVRGVELPARRWPFLSGDQLAIERLAKTIGYRYTRLEKSNFAHPSVFIVLTPDGKVARYLYGLEIRPADLKLALTEAAGGKIGGSPFINQVLLYCYHYDPVGKKYGLAAVNIMKITGVVIIVFLALLLIPLWRADKRRKEESGGPEAGNR